MNLQLRSVADAGDMNKERITLRAVTRLDVGDFLLVQSGYANGDVNTAIFHAFWFPYDAVEQGDLVVVYTKAGTPRTRELSTGKVAHFFYWGLPAPIWSDTERAAVVLNAPTWEAKSSADLKR